MHSRRFRLFPVLAPLLGAALTLGASATPAQSMPVNEAMVTTTTRAISTVDATRTVARADASVDVAYTAVASNMQRLLDRCDGAVAITIDGIRPKLLAEHDYCGGRWVLGLDRGDIVRIEGGNIGGRYRAGEIKVVRKGSSAGVLRGMGAVVAQTCRPDGDTLRLVGLSRIT